MINKITRLIKSLFKIFSWLVSFCNCMDPFSKLVIPVMKSTKQIVQLKAEFVKESNGPVKSYFSSFFDRIHSNLYVLSG